MMAKFNPSRSAQEGNITNSSASTTQEKEKQRRPSSSRPSSRPSSRRSSYDSAIQGNGVVLAKNERYVSAHDYGHSRPASINATFEDGVVMESGFRGHLVV